MAGRSRISSMRRARFLYSVSAFAQDYLAVPVDARLDQLASLRAALTAALNADPHPF
jgi:hypothetical protein